MIKIKILLITLLLIGCSSSSDSNPLNTPITVAPRVTGILVTDASGNILYPWGEVPGVSFNDYTSQYRIAGNIYAYPNPTNGKTNIRYAVPSSFLDVSVYVVKALGPSDELDQYYMINGASNFYQKAGNIIRTLVNDEQDRGIHILTWNLTDNNDLLVQSGFYRIFIIIGEDQYFVDILVVWSNEDLPPGFPAIYGEN